MNGRVAILDDDRDMCTVLCRVLKNRLGVECQAYTNLDQFRNGVNELHTCGFVILDVNLGHGLPTGLEAHSWLMESGFKGRVCFLTGHARNHPLVKEAALRGVEVLEKPVGMDRLCDVVKSAIALREGSVDA